MGDKDIIYNNYFLVGDIGGTNSNFSLIKFSSDYKNYVILKNINFKTNCIDDIISFFTHFLDNFLSEFKINTSNLSLVLGVAGRVIENRVVMSNVNLTFVKEELLNKFNFKNLNIINDFKALSYSIYSFKKSDLLFLNDFGGHFEFDDNNNNNNLFEDYINFYKNKKVLFVGAGTGLGVSYIKDNVFLDSEGGHQKFLPINDFDRNLEIFLKNNLNKNILEFEDLISGRGIVNIFNYLFFKSNGYNNIEHVSAENIFKFRKNNILFEETFNLFFNYYAQFINLVSVKFKPDLIFIGGGIIEKNLDFNRELFLNNLKINNSFVFIIKNYNSSINGLIEYVKINFG